MNVPQFFIFAHIQGRNWCVFLFDKNFIIVFLMDVVLTEVFLTLHDYNFAQSQVW